MDLGEIASSEAELVDSVRINRLLPISLSPPELTAGQPPLLAGMQQPPEHTAVQPAEPILDQPPAALTVVQPPAPDTALLRTLPVRVGLSESPGAAGPPNADTPPAAPRTPAAILAIRPDLECEGTFTAREAPYMTVSSRPPVQSRLVRPSAQDLFSEIHVASVPPMENSDGTAGECDAVIMFSEVVSRQGDQSPGLFFLELKRPSEVPGS